MGRRAAGPKPPLTARHFHRRRAPAIVKHIVQLHHGTLDIESRVGERTTVTVSLPVAAA